MFAGAPTLAGANPGQFSIANNTCTGTVASGGGCSFDVHVRTDRAPRRRPQRVQFAATPAIADYQVSGTGTPGGSISVDASSLDFGGVKVGTSSAKTVTVRNTGTDNVTLGSIVASQSPYAVSGGCGGTVLATNGGSCTITVTFTPTAAGALPADLTIPYTGATDVSKVVSLTGTGTQPQLAFTPSTGLDFSIGIGDTTAPQALSIKNTGDATMNISGITIAGTGAARFAIASQTCGATLAAGRDLHGQRHVHADRRRRLQRDSCTSPTTRLDNPHDANLTGTATVPGVPDHADVADVPAQQDGTLGTTMQVTVKNTSASASLKVGTLTIGGTNTGSFIFDATAAMPARARPSPPVRRAPSRSRFRPHADRRRRAPRCRSPATPTRPRTSRCWERRSRRRPSEACTGASGCTKANIGLDDADAAALRQGAGRPQPRPRAEDPDRRHRARPTAPARSTTPACRCRARTTTACSR